MFAKLYDIDVGVNMNCIGFPKMFGGRSSTVVKTDDKNSEATKECIYLLVSSEKREMFGDPDFGVRLKYYTFDQNNYVLRDILIDELYTQITTFCPQIYIDRKNIIIKQSGKNLLATISYKNVKDFVTNTFELVLLSEDED